MSNRLIVVNARMNRSLQEGAERAFFFPRELLRSARRPTLHAAPHEDGELRDGDHGHVLDVHAPSQVFKLPRGLHV